MSNPNPAWAMLALVSAVAANGAIGCNGRQPFFIPEDLARFRRLTLGHPVLMGRRTFESLPHGALPGRRNLVLTCRTAFSAPGAEVFPSLAAALSACGAADVFVIGGGQVYAEALPLADSLRLTHIHAPAIPADTFFPQIDESEWRLVHSERHLSADGNLPPFTFADYVRV